MHGKVLILSSLKVNSPFYRTKKSLWLHQYHHHLEFSLQKDFIIIFLEHQEHDPLKNLKSNSYHCISCLRYCFFLGFPSYRDQILKDLIVK